MGCEDVKWIHVTRVEIEWRTLVNVAMNLQVP
jgi:hypothetical protein